MSEPHKLCINCRHFDPANRACRKIGGGVKANILRLNPNKCGPDARQFEAKP